MAAPPPPTSAAPCRAAADTVAAADSEVCAGQLSIIQIGTGTGGEAAAPVVLGLLCKTGRMDLVGFFKGAQDRTSEAVFPVDCGTHRDIYDHSSFVDLCLML
jgi:hypothetical protein